MEGNAEIDNVATIESARLIADALDRTDIVEEDVAQIERIGDRLLTTSDEIPPSVHTNGVLNRFTSALNHPAGQVAIARVKAVSKRVKAAGDTWAGLTPNTRERFERLLDGDGHNATLAQVIFSGYAGFLFAADRHWTQAKVLPFFDWTADPTRAGQAWKGFLTRGRWNDALFNDMLSFTEQTFTRIDHLGDEGRDFVRILANVAAHSHLDPWAQSGWLFQFMREAAEAHRTEWAREFGRSLEVLPSEGISAVWQRWLSSYWQARLTGVPRPFADSEREAMISWVCPLKGYLPEVIHHLTSAPPTALDHFTLYRLDQCGLAKSNGADIARLLSALLPHVSELRDDTGELFDLAASALANGAERVHLHRIAGEMLRFGLSDGERLRRMSDDLPPPGGDGRP